MLVRYTQRHPERHSLRPCVVHDPIRRLQLAASKLFYGLNKSTRAVAHVFLQIWVAERLLNVRLPGPLWAVTTVRCPPLISDADRGRDRECGGA